MLENVNWNVMDIWKTFSLQAIWRWHVYTTSKISSRFSRVNIFVLMVKKLVQTSTSIYKKLNGQYYLICIEIIYVARSF